MSTQTTTVIQIAHAGGPEVLELREVPLAAPARGEVQLRQTAIGVNFIDVYNRTGLYPPPQYPYTPGVEGAGVVESVGADVRDVKVGDHVAYASRPIGAYAARRNFPADRLVKLPAHVSDETAAAIMLKGMTAQCLLHRVFRVERGHTVLVHAAAGGVGSILVPWARALGATVIGLVGSDAKAARVREMGAQHVVVYTREKFAERVREITGGKGVQVVYDSVGKDTFVSSLECLATRGMLVSFGQSSGKIPPFDITLLAKGSLFLSRPTLFDYIATREELVATARDLFEQIEKRLVESPVQRKYALKDAAEAHRDLEGRKTTGSNLLLP